VTGPTPPELLTNAHVARLLSEMADLLAIRGDSSFKVLAYRRAADAVARSPFEVAAAIREGRPPRLPGVGATIGEGLAELAGSGRLPALEALREEVPPSLLSILALPGVGPHTAGSVWRTLGVATLADLVVAARAGRLRSLRGMSARTEARILAAVEALERHPPRRMRMAEAHALAEAVLQVIAGLPGARSAIVAGSLRRGAPTVGDLDVLVESDRPREVLRALAGSGLGAADEPAVDGAEPEQAGAGSHGRGSLRLVDGTRLDVMTMPPGRAGTYLVHLTGSAEHNARLRHRARQRGWSLSEHGFAPLAEEEREPTGTRSGETGGLVTFATEAEVYAFLGLAPIEPELREDRGEVEAAASGALPRLVRREDLQGDCHSHSDWSDGREPLVDMVEAARRAGLAYLVLTDHSQGLGIANGLSPDRVRQQRRVLDELNERFAREEATGAMPAGSHPDGFRVLHGCELEILPDGRLDYEDELLAAFDVVVASLHVGRRQPREQLMARYAAAMRSPHVDVIAHPSGRRIGRRPDLDLDWEAFYRLAAESGTLLEVNGSPERLDLDGHRVRAATEAGCRFVVDSDAHAVAERGNLEWGIRVARRGWLPAERVVNTLPRERFLALLADKAGRAGG
jgi:DNA polymerase (family 10)